MSGFLGKRSRSNSSSRSSDTSNSQSSAVKKAKTEYDKNIQKFIDDYEYSVEEINKKDYAHLHLCTFKTPIIYTFYLDFSVFYSLEHIFHFYYKDLPKCSYNILLE